MRYRTCSSVLVATTRGNKETRSHKLGNGTVAHAKPGRRDGMLAPPLHLSKVRMMSTRAPLHPGRLWAQFRRRCSADGLTLCNRLPGGGNGSARADLLPERGSDIPRKAGRSRGVRIPGVLPLLGPYKTAARKCRRRAVQRRVRRQGRPGRPLCDL